MEGEMESICLAVCGCEACHCGQHPKQEMCLVSWPEWTPTD